MPENYFILDESNNPVPTTRQVLLKYMAGSGRGRKRLAYSVVNRYRIITKFTGVYFGDQVPKLFKTDVYNNNRVIIATKFYTTYDDALKGHAEIVERLSENDRTTKD